MATFVHWLFVLRHVYFTDTLASYLLMWNYLVDLLLWLLVSPAIPQAALRARCLFHQARQEGALSSLICKFV